MPKVSVIMPSLNVAPYIRECMDSVVNQTLHDIEVICIDAGSTDGTWEILEEYAAADRRVRLIHSDKKSYGYQMNLGFKEATGEYIGIVETDDYILPTMYEELYAYAVEHDADFVKSDFHIFISPSEGERLFLKFPLRTAYNTLITDWDYINNGQDIDTFIWNGIYKRTFLLENQIRFQETPGAAYQDCGFRFQIALSVKRGFFLDKSFYRYRRDNAGSSMYNSKCVLYNLSECKYILKIAQERGWTDRIRMRFLAQNIAQLAYGPYKEMLPWCQPVDETDKALEEFRSMVKEFISQELVYPLLLPEYIWLRIRMFVDSPQFFEYHAKLEADILVESFKKFLQNASKRKQIVIFGNGRLGNAAYCAIRNSGLRNVAAFCDNDPKKWETECLGCPVKSPEAAVAEFPEAHFIIANSLHQAEIKKQLIALGISYEQLEVYNLSSSPMICTNKSFQQFI